MALSLDRCFRRQLRTEAPFQFLADLGDLHSGHHDELAAQHLTCLIVVRQLRRDAAILAILIPAETPVGNRLRADELKAAQDGIFLRHLEFSPQDGDLHQLLVRTKWFRHKHPGPPHASLRWAAVTSDLVRD